MRIEIPGKLVLVGEYAVLTPGQPAVAAGVDRRAVASIEGGEVVVDTGAHHDRESGRKLGFGSSAAVAVARAALTAGASGVLEGRAAFAAARAEHERMGQTGGSGVDLAACALGGLVRYDQAVGPEPLPVPDGLLLLVGWTGHEARTKEFTPRVAGALAARPAEREAFHRLSRMAVDWLVDGIVRSDPDEIATAVSGGLAAMRYLAEVTEVPIFTPELDALVRVALAEGVPAKPSGAGGGDCGVALTFDPALAERVREAWRAAGIEPIDVAIDRAGVRVVE